MKIPTTKNANDPTCLYIRLMYREWWFGPFKDEDEVINALRTLDNEDSMWDYDCFAIHYGVVGMKDVIEDPVYVTGEVRQRIEKARRDATR